MKSRKALFARSLILWSCAATGAIAGAVFVLARHSMRDLPTATIARLTLLVLWRWTVPEPAIVVFSGIAGLLRPSSIGVK